MTLAPVTEVPPTMPTAAAGPCARLDALADLFEYCTRQAIGVSERLEAGDYTESYARERALFLIRTVIRVGGEF